MTSLTFNLFEEKLTQYYTQYTLSSLTTDDFNLTTITSELPTNCTDYHLPTLGTYLIQLEGGKPIMGPCEPDNDGNWLVSSVTTDCCLNEIM